MITSLTNGRGGDGGRGRGQEEEGGVLTRVVPNGTEGTERPRERVAVARLENAFLLSPPFHFRKCEMRAV